MFSEILIKTQQFSFTKMQMKISSANGGYFVQRDLSLHNVTMYHVYTSDNYTIIGSDNGLLPIRHQAII